MRGQSAVGSKDSDLSSDLTLVRFGRLLLLAAGLSVHFGTQHNKEKPPIGERGLSLFRAHSRYHFWRPTSHSLPLRPGPWHAVAAGPRVAAETALDVLREALESELGERTGT